MKKNLTHNLKTYRKAYGLSAQKMADKLKVKHRATYYSWEKGQSEPNITSLMNISIVLNAPIDKLLFTEVVFNERDRIYPEQDNYKYPPHTEGEEKIVNDRVGQFTPDVNGNSCDNCRFRNNPDPQFNMNECHACIEDAPNYNIFQHWESIQSPLPEKVFVGKKKEEDQIWTEEENDLRQFKNMMERRGLTCLDCQWGMEKDADGTGFTTCGHHIQNFTQTSYCGYFTDPKDPKLVAYFERRKKAIKKRLDNQKPD